MRVQVGLLLLTEIAILRGLLWGDSTGVDKMSCEDVCRDEHSGLQSLSLNRGKGTKSTITKCQCPNDAGMELP
ncbi:unnamed protein product [Allacma fusca]|uniref:Secreted protein n=1 Tax=Allacma fusca TaxID=39272 RepID=A0A8J2JU61_9HEXA|nr:unnamed protein product [Allacma fusca]